MEKKPFKPYVAHDSNLAELTIKAMVLGVLMAVVLGAANAYLGMKAGLTVAATFPAAVVAMAALKPFRGTILEENIARTTASVGEALVAGEWNAVKDTIKLSRGGAPEAVRGQRVADSRVVLRTQGRCSLGVRISAWGHGKPWTRGDSDSVR